MKPIVYGWKEIKVILISQKDFMEKAKLEWFFASQRELEKLCDSKSLSWPKERFSELSTNINLVKNPDPTIASYNVGHMSIYWIFPLVTAYFGLVKLHPISFCLSFGDVYLNKFLRLHVLKPNRTVSRILDIIVFVWKTTKAFQKFQKNISYLRVIN